MKKGSAKPNGNLPLMCRLMVDGEIKQFSCKMDVSPHLWDVKNNRASGKSIEAQRINRAVDKIRVEANRRYQELMKTDRYVTAAKLKDAYLGIGVKQETLLKLFEQHNAEFEKKVGHSRAQGTFRRYQTVCNHIREFLPHTYKREDIPLKELNLTFINDFEYFLRTEKKCRTNTVWGYMIVLKHIVSIARNDGRLPFNPFAGYINSPECVDRGYLTQTEIQTLMDAPMKNAAHELVRDLFVFSAFTGLAYSDVKNLTADRLQTFFDGNLWIITRRKKTNTESNIRLLDVPKRIIEKYKGLARDGHVFLVPSNGSCNKILKGIGRQCGFKMRLTYHVARHKEEISFLKTIIAKAAACFPYLREMLRIKNLCRLVGFDERQTATLVSGKPLEYAGELYSEEHKRKFTTEKAGFQVMKDTTDKTKLVLVIDRKPIVEWFKEQFDKLRQNIRQPIPRQNRLKI